MLCVAPEQSCLLHPQVFCGISRLRQPTFTTTKWILELLNVGRKISIFSNCYGVKGRNYAHMRADYQDRCTAALQFYKSLTVLIRGIFHTTRNRLPERVATIQYMNSTTNIYQWWSYTSSFSPASKNNHMTNINVYGLYQLRMVHLNWYWMNKFGNGRSLLVNHHPFYQKYIRWLLDLPLRDYKPSILSP